MLNRALPDLLRDALVAIAPGLSHLLVGWLVLS